MQQIAGYSGWSQPVIQTQSSWCAAGSGNPDTLLGVMWACCSARKSSVRLYAQCGRAEAQMLLPPWRLAAPKMSPSISSGASAEGSKWKVLNTAAEARTCSTHTSDWSVHLDKDDLSLKAVDGLAKTNQAGLCVCMALRSKCSNCPAFCNQASCIGGRQHRGA